MTESGDDESNSQPGPGSIDRHKADRPANAAEEAAADEQYADDTDAHRAEVAKHEKEMMEIGADVKGEGEIV